MACPQWRVSGGSTTGGIIVRTGQTLDAPEAVQRLSTGAVVDELQGIENRLHYRLVSGSGPAEGWVSMTHRGKPLLVSRTDKNSASRAGYVAMGHGPDRVQIADAALGSAAPCVYALSDLHTDHADNMKVIEQIAPRQDDVILLAGDISHDMEVIRRTFEIFISKFRYVFYCPGNHDLWVHSKDRFVDSLEKLNGLMALCEELGVITKPKAVGGGIFIVPLLSWYEPDFDQDPNVEDASLTPVEQTMTDFFMCKWPPGLSATDSSLARHLDSLNEELPDISEHKVVISFSHFLPRPELVPEKRFLFYPPLPKAIGSLALRERVRLLHPSCHVFGHTHYGWSMDLDGIHYLQAAVAYPRERTDRGFSLSLCPAEQQKQAYGVKSGVVDPVLVYDAPLGALVHWDAFWSSYYAKHSRHPQDVRWIYRRPRNKDAVKLAMKSLVDSGQVVADKAIALLIGEHIVVA